MHSIRNAKMQYNVAPCPVITVGKAFTQVLDRCFSNKWPKSSTTKPKDADSSSPRSFKSSKTSLTGSNNHNLTSLTIMNYGTWTVSNKNWSKLYMNLMATAKQLVGGKRWNFVRNYKKIQNKKRWNLSNIMKYWINSWNSMNLRKRNVFQ